MTSFTTSSTRASDWNNTLRQFARRNPLVMIGLVVALAWFALALLGPALAPRDPLKQAVETRLQAPGGDYSLGSDELGRDVFTRVLYGARMTIPAGLAVVFIGSILGSLIGALAGYIGGLWDEIIMRLTELVMAFPTIILALAITAALGPNLRTAILALVLVWWPGYARVMRGLVLEIKAQDYVEAARAAGANGRYILFRTIIPNCISPAIILATLDIGTAILTFAGLSFLGLGPEPSTPEWGRMVSIGIDYFDQWWMWLFPGGAIASLVLAFNFIGDGLRDLLDPRLRNR